MVIVFAVSLFFGVSSAASAQPQPTIGLDEIHRGMKGYGLSVFAGTEPQRFEVEVLGVIHNQTPELSYILTRLSGQDLERSGVAGGMSGSPIYFDDRLAGALAYGYMFGLDAIAGITPIAGMRKLHDLPGTSSVAAPSVDAAVGFEPPTFEALVRGDWLSSGDGTTSAERLNRALTLLASSTIGSPQGAQPTWTWHAGGFGPRTLSLLEGSLGRLAPALSDGGGVGTTDAATLQAATEALGGGSAVSVVLVEGDLTLASHGTVTERRGDQIIAFGHPMFSLGPVSLPLAISEVVTVVASRANAFKVSNAGPVIGVLEQDREAGVRGRIGGPPAPQTALEVRLRGLVDRDYSMRVTGQQILRPLMLTLSTLGALDAGSTSGGYQGIDLDLRFELGGMDDLVIRQSFDGGSAGTDAALALLSFAAFLEFNAWQALDLRSVDITLTQVDYPRVSNLVSAHATRQEVRPGDTVPVVLELDPYRGERFRRTVEVQIPERVPDGTYYVILGDGTSMDAVELTVEKRQPETLAQAMGSLRSLRSRKQLVIDGLVARPGVALRGDSMPGLPASVRSIFGASGRPEAVPLSLAIAHSQTLELDEPIDGAARIDLTVRRRP